MSDNTPAKTETETETSQPPPPAPPPAPKRPTEIGGVEGPEPTRYGDWQHKGRCTDFENILQLLLWRAGASPPRSALDLLAGA